MQGIVDFGDSSSPSPSSSHSSQGQSPPDSTLAVVPPPAHTLQHSFLAHPVALAAAAVQPLPFRTAAAPPAPIPATAAAAPALQAPRAGFSGQSKACNTCRKRKKGVSQSPSSLLPCYLLHRAWRISVLLGTPQDGMLSSPPPLTPLICPVRPAAPSLLAMP